MVTHTHRINNAYNLQDSTKTSSTSVFDSSVFIERRNMILNALSHSAALESSVDRRLDFVTKRQHQIERLVVITLSLLFNLISCMIHYIFVMS